MALVNTLMTDSGGGGSSKKSGVKPAQQTTVNSSGISQNAGQVYNTMSPYLNDAQKQQLASDLTRGNGNQTATQMIDAYWGDLGLGNNNATSSSSSSASSRGLSGGSSGGGEVYYGGDASYNPGPSAFDISKAQGDFDTVRNDYLNQIKKLLGEEQARQESAVEKQYKSLIDKANASYAEAEALAQEVYDRTYNTAKTSYDKSNVLANENYDTSRNDIVRNDAYLRRWLQQQYGGGASGSGLSNQLRAYTNYNNNLNNALRTRANNLNEILTTFNNAQADAQAIRNNSLRTAGNVRQEAKNSADVYRAGGLADAQKYYSTNYSNAAQNLYNADLDMAYKKYGLGLDYASQQEKNKLDLDYRKYLASLGL